MKAAFIQQPGPAESLTYAEFPAPELGPQDVFVKVAAVSVNPVDTYLRAGLVQMPIPLPYIVGCDLAGTVDAVGPEVRSFKVGDRVWGSNQGLLGRQGTFAEYAAVHQQWLYPIPVGVDEKQMAAIALVGITAHLGLLAHAHLQAQETIFVVGGSGGVGSMVVQMSKVLGAHVVTTAGSPAKAQRCRDFGADEVILYRQESVDQRLSELCPEGVDVWWETTREPNFEAAVPHLAPRGRFVLMAGRDARPSFPVGPFYVKDCSLHGFAMFNASANQQQRSADDINRWVASGKLVANIDRVLPLSEAAAAHQLQEDATIHKTVELAGKIVLEPAAS